MLTSYSPPGGTEDLMGTPHSLSMERRGELVSRSPRGNHVQGHDGSSSPASSASDTGNSQHSGDQGDTPHQEEGSGEGGRKSLSSQRASMEAAPYDFNDPMFSTDEFRVWEMKIRKCPKSRPHDWTMCPFAHPGEKAKRRDPRMYNYCGTACAEYRKTGACARGDSCMYAHGVFECWLHPSRYRTQLCTDGIACSRRVCFFAHRESELRKPVGGVIPSVPYPNATDTSMDHQKVHHGIADSQHTDSSLNAAIQMLDPLSKRKLLEALQKDLQASAASSAFFSSSEADVPRMQSQGQDEIQTSLLDAIQRLQLNSMGGMHARNSIDTPFPTTASHTVGGHSSGIPSYQQYLNANSRRSVDIGALSRGMNALLGRPSGEYVPQNGVPNTMMMHPPSGRSSMDGLYRNYVPPTAVTRAFTEASHDLPEPLGNSRYPSDFGIVETNHFTDDNGAQAQLARILEHVQENESESSGSSASIFARSGSGSSSLDGGLHAERKQFGRVFSIDNLLADLPRSSSQVDLPSGQ